MAKKEQSNSSNNRRKGSGALIGGGILILLGLMYLFPVLQIQRFWPLILIVIGVGIIWSHYNQ